MTREDWSETKIIDELCQHYGVAASEFDPDKQPQDDLTVLDCISNWFWYNILHFCGCGAPELAEDIIQKALTVYATDDTDGSLREELFGENRTVYDAPMWLFVFYALDAAGLTDHGPSVNWGWLTNLGKMYLWVLNERRWLHD